MRACIVDCSEAILLGDYHLFTEHQGFAETCLGWMSCFPLRKSSAFSWILRDESDTFLAERATPHGKNHRGGRCWGGVSLARSAPPGVNFQLSFSSQRRIGAATSGSVTARGCLSTTGAQGLPCPAPCLHHPAVLREGQVPDGRGHPGGDRHSEGDTQATRCC